MRLTMVVLGTNLNNMKFKNWILKKKVAIVIAFIGAIGGYLYWHFVGCATGNCGITANWHSSMGFGSIMGWLIGDMISDKLKKNTNEN